MTTKLSIAPLSGVAGVGFGSSRASVITTLGVPQRSFKRSSFATYAIDIWFDGSMQVSYAGEVPAVEFIEFSHGPNVDVLLFGVPVFDTPSGELLKTVKAQIDWEESEDGCSFTCPSMELALWRSRADDALPFESLGVGEKGYYSECCQ